MNQGMFRVNLIAGVMIAALLLSGCQAGVKPAADDGALTASGTIRTDEVRLSSEMGGRIVEVRAQVGAEVRAGQVLVLLNETSIATGLAEAEAAVAAAQADLAAVRAGARVEEIDAARAALSLAQAERDGALARWENAQEVVQNPQELDARIAEAQANVNLAAQSVELARAELARQRLLRDQVAEGSMEREVADLQVQSAEASLAAAQADAQTAQTALDWLVLIRGEPLALIGQAHTAEGQYRVAAAGAAAALARLDDLLAGPTPQEISAAESVVRQARAQVEVLRAQQAKFALTSPLDGVVLDQALQAGEVAAPMATILTLADLGQVTLIVYVPEDRIGAVRLGQGVSVTVDSFPGRVFSGRVTRIGDEPEFTPRNVATKEERRNTFYAVEVQLPNPDGALKPGMPADAVFGE